MEKGEVDFQNALENKLKFNHMNYSIYWHDPLIAQVLTDVWVATNLACVFSSVQKQVLITLDLLF